MLIKMSTQQICHVAGDFKYDKSSFHIIIAILTSIIAISTAAIIAILTVINPVIGSNNCLGIEVPTRRLQASGRSGLEQALACPGQHVGGEQGFVEGRPGPRQLRVPDRPP